MNLSPVLQELGIEDSSIFKDAIIKLDLKEFSNTISICDSLLLRRKNHPETIALKAMAICHIEILDETPPSLEDSKSIPLVKESLKTLLGLKSSFCWHSAAQIHRMKREWLESVKCYKQAIKIEIGNGKKKEFNATLHQLQREICQVLTQTKSWSDLVKYRFDILVARPSFKHNWIALALAYYFDAKLEASGSILDAILFDYPISPRKEDIRIEHIERFELFMFRLEKCLIPLKKYSSALLLMLEEENEQEKLLTSHFFTKMEPWLLLKADILKNLSRIEEAKEIWYKLMEDNASNHFKLYLETFRDKDEKNFFLKGELSKGKILDSHLREEILSLNQQCQQSLLSVIDPLLKRGGHLSLIEFIPPLATLALEDVTLPSQLLKAQILYRDGDLSSSLKVLESLIMEFGATGDILSTYEKIHPNYSLKKKISLTLIKMFPKDKSYVCQAVKNILRDGGGQTPSKYEEAEELMLTFARNPKLKDPRLIRLFKLADLEELQCIWYFKELASSLLDDGEFIESLMYCRMMWKMFDDFSEDKYDFHNYIFRKSTLSSYVEMVSFEALNTEFTSIASIAIKAIMALKNDPNSGGIGIASLSIIDEVEEEVEQEVEEEENTKPGEEENTKAIVDGNTKAIVEENTKPEAEEDGKEKIKAINLLKKRKIERIKISQQLKDHYTECEEKWVLPLVKRRSDLKETHQIAFQFYSSFEGNKALVNATKALFSLNKMGHPCSLENCEKIREKILKKDEKDPCRMAILEIILELKPQKLQPEVCKIKNDDIPDCRELNIFLEKFS